VRKSNSPYIILNTKPPMAKKRNNSQNTKPNLPTNLSELQKFRQELAVKEMMIIEKALKSNSPSDIISAQNYIKGVQQKKESTLSAFTLAPEHEFYNGLGYKNKPTSLTYELLRQMAKIPQIAAIIQTRIDQAMNYNNFTTDAQKPGWTIRKRTGKFATDKDKALSDGDKRNIEGIATWIENGGNDVNEWEGDDWDEFRKKLYRDSWTLDQASFEVSWLRKGIPHQYQVVDGATMRFAETFEDREYQKEKENQGYFPKYVQVWRNQVHKEFYPWEMCMGMRNPSSSVWNNGYSTSEIETLIQVITWMLYGMQYNGNFFQQGSNPKGILNFKSGADQTQVEAFKQGWRNTLTGVMNSHKLAVVAGADLEWVNMQQNNKDMEFHQWNEFLTVLSCVMFRIDPDEVGFHMQGSRGMFGQDGQRERIQHSKEKGLEPFLNYWQTQFDKYMVKSLSKGAYEFAFTGIDVENEELILDKDIKLLTNGGMSLQDFFVKYSGKELNKEKDIILNQIFLQYKMMDQSGSPESNEAVDDMTGEPEGNPFAEFEKGGKDDPFMKVLNNYIEKGVKNGE